MADQAPVQTEQSPTTATPHAGVDNAPELDLDALSLDDIEKIFAGGKVDVPVKSGAREAAAAPAAIQTPPVKTEAKAGEQSPEPASTEQPEATQEEVVETRSAEEIQAHQEAAREKVIADGGDEAAQEAAFEAAGQPGYTPEASVTTEEEEDDEEEEENDKPKRIRAKRRHRLILSLVQESEASGNPITFAEAEARIDGPKREPVQVEPPVDHQARIDAVSSEIATTQAELDKFEEGLFTPEIRKLQEKLSDLKLDLRDANRDQQEAQKEADRRQAEADAASDRRRNASHDKAVEEYPDVESKKTPLGKAVSEYIREIKDPKHPDHYLLGLDNCPLLIASRKAAELGILPKTAKPSKNGKTPSTATTTVTPPPRKVMTPPGGHKTSQVAPKPAEDARVKVQALLDSDNLEELDRAQGMVGGNPLAGLRR